MKKKTMDRLERKWLNLPLHHIDACVILEALIKHKGYEDCENYLNRVGYKYIGDLSIFALGEIVMTSIRKFEKEMEYNESSLIIARLIDKRKIGFSSPQFKTYDIVKKIKAIESRVEPMDALNLATAITENADVFVTLDGTLLENKKLEKEFEIKIKHPADL
ncbi:MAG: hypothetical protein CVT88_06815 [Candidatus Altiarchaeales archaeon HGW-Altiarchaeales-1]|nr:MAG: hypothetical protein CVT88_06815 [Candidatus Altiarchaeales archaeon HGW-Altiarchaeales-1]